MAEIQTAPRGKTSRRRPPVPRVDLTPMVDLGFLLITFFMFTTTLAKPMVMELSVPPRAPDNAAGPAIPAESTLILLPAAGHKIAYYRGTDAVLKTLYWCSFGGANDVRSLLMQEESRVAGLPSGMSAAAHRLHVLIKPDESASYDDLVRILDEMGIAAVPYYTIMHRSNDEAEALKKFRPRDMENGH